MKQLTIGVFKPSGNDKNDKKNDKDDKNDNMKIYQLSENAMVWHYPTFLDSTTQDNLYNHLLTNVPWKTGMYGDLKLPRLLWSMKDEKTTLNADYQKYTGTRASNFTLPMLDLKNKIEQEFNVKLSYCQLNYYENGHHYISWHADREMRPGDCVYSISLGEARVFRMRCKKTKKQVQKFILESGSLLIFNTSAGKDEFEHSIDKDVKIKNGRINISFRN